MKRPAAAAAEYLNVDLEVRSRADLKPLADTLSPRLIALYVGREGRSLLRALARCRGLQSRRPAIAAFRRLLRAIDDLPADRRRVLLAPSARSRVRRRRRRGRRGRACFAPPAQVGRLRRGRAASSSSSRPDHLPGLDRSVDASAGLLAVKHRQLGPRSAKRGTDSRRSKASSRPSHASSPQRAADSRVAGSRSEPAARCSRFVVQRCEPEDRRRSRRRRRGCAQGRVERIVAR